MRTVHVFFDLEDLSHSPRHGEAAVEEDVRRISICLERNGAKAVFNTSGVLVERHPAMIQELHGEGHEIASHGYQHENFVQLTPEELGQVLARTEALIMGVTGERPVGVRCPWLMSDHGIYQVIGSRGYRWASNMAFEFPELEHRPDCGAAPGGGPLSFVSRRRAERAQGRRWAAYRKAPFRRDGMWEIPLLSCMDGDLLCYVSPLQRSPDQWLDYAYESLVAQFHRSEGYFNLNFHPWLIASSNRLTLLDRILGYVSEQDVEFALPRELP